MWALDGISGLKKYIFFVVLFLFCITRRIRRMVHTKNSKKNKTKKNQRSSCGSGSTTGQKKYK
jgi:hypothetical protein